MTTKWKILPEKTTETWLQVEDPEGWYGAIVKWDGCIHFDAYANVPIHERTGDPKEEHRELVDYIHICDIDDMIARLQDLREVAVSHFGEKWPEL